MHSTAATTTGGAGNATVSSSSSSAPLLSALFVFKNILNQELVKSIHVYQVPGEKERWLEREFLFSPATCVEIRAPNLEPLLLASPAIGGDDAERPRFRVGDMAGLWFCILAFDSAMKSLPSSPIPPILSLCRNPRLKSIPTLLDDLLLMRRQTENLKLTSFASEGTCVDELNSAKLIHNELTCYEDRSHSCPVIKQVSSKNQQCQKSLQEHDISMKKMKRAATEHVASIALTDLIKYFNLPILEASRKLNVGLTVLKRKCREFGIPRWPHRKIKSLETLIHNLQEEVHQQERENKSAAVKAVERRKRMLESEKEGIERNPFLELQRETKRFRQDVFKRRHRAKALSKKCSESFDDQTCLHSC